MTRVEEQDVQSPHPVIVDCSDSLSGQFAASVMAGQGSTVVRLGAGTPFSRTPVDRFVDRGVRYSNDVEEIVRMLATADVLIVSSASGLWGSIPELIARFSRLVVLAVTPFGLTGPDRDRPATALTLAAESGWLGITGDPDRAPEPIRGHVMEFAGAWAAASIAWAALRMRNLTGRGVLVDVSLLEVFVYLQWNSTQRAAFENAVMQRQGGRGTGHPWGIYPCKDGHVILIVGAGGRNWTRFAELMDAPDLADERFLSPRTRAEHADEIDALMIPWLTDHTADEIFHAAQAEGLPFGTVIRPADLPSDPQLAAREFFQRDADGLSWAQLPFRINGERRHWPGLLTVGDV